MSFRRLLPFVASLLASLSAPAVAFDWGPNGIAVCGSACVADLPMTLPDGEGGAFIAWRDSRSYSQTDEDVYLQRITSAGQISPGWPMGGFPVCVAPRSQQLSGIAPDGQGGVLVVWQDQRNAETTSADIYAQRVRADGTLAPGWPANGSPVSRTPGYQSAPSIAPSGAGGAYVAWDDWTDYGSLTTVYVQHLTPAGVPADSWPADGLRVSPNPSGAASVIPDGAGGVILILGEAQNPEGGVFAVRLTPTGMVAPGWPEGGVPITQPGCAFRAANSDGSGAFYVACAVVEFDDFSDHEYYLQRLLFDGTRAPGWPEGGVPVCTAPGHRVGPRMVSDGSGGVVLAWFDYRAPEGGSDVYVSRFLADGSLAAGWQSDGVLVSNPAEPLEVNVDVAPDGSGGAYVTWLWYTSTGYPSKLEHVLSTGTVDPAWPLYGTRVAETNSQFTPRLAPDGAGGVIVAWDEASLLAGRLGIYAQHFSPQGPVPALPTLASADASPEGVILLWIASHVTPSQATVYRRPAQGDWQPLGAPTSDGSARLRYEDRSVAAGERYAYRLGLRERGEEIFTAETWVDVPRELTLQLQGFTPNPVVGPRMVSFTLPTAAPATLELFNVAGRRVIVREVGSLGPGRHVVNLGERTELAAGVYWMRLNQEEHSPTARGVIVR